MHIHPKKDGFFVLDITDNLDPLFSYDIPEYTNDIHIFLDYLDKSLKALNFEYYECRGMVEFQKIMDRYVSNGSKYAGIAKEIIADFVDYILCA